MAKEYIYRMMARPFSFGTHPKANFVRHEDDGSRFGAVVYSDPVPASDCVNFSLRPITEAKDLAGLVFGIPFGSDLIPCKVLDVDNDGMIRFQVEGENEMTASYFRFFEEIGEDAKVMKEDDSSGPDEPNDLNELQQVNDLNEFKASLKAVKTANSALPKREKYDAVSMSLNGCPVCLCFENLQTINDLLKLCNDAKVYLDAKCLLVTDGAFRASVGLCERTNDLKVFYSAKQVERVTINKDLFKFTTKKEDRAFDGVYMDQTERIAIATNNHSLLLSAVDFVELPESTLLDKTGIKLVNNAGDKYRTPDYIGIFEKWIDTQMNEFSFEQIKIDLKLSISRKLSHINLECDGYKVILSLQQMKQLQWLKPQRLYINKTSVIAVASGRIAMFITNHASDEMKKDIETITVASFIESAGIKWRDMIHQELPANEQKKTRKKTSTKKVEPADAIQETATEQPYQPNELDAVERVDQPNESEIQIEHIEKPTNKANEYVYTYSHSNCIAVSLNDYQAYGFTSTTIEAESYAIASDISEDVISDTPSETTKTTDTGFYFNRRGNYWKYTQTAEIKPFPLQKWDITASGRMLHPNERTICFRTIALHESGISPPGAYYTPKRVKQVERINNTS